MDETLAIRFRVDRVYKNCRVNVLFDDEVISQKKRLVATPGEMEEIRVVREQLEGYPSLHKITIKIEER